MAAVEATAKSPTTSTRRRSPPGQRHHATHEQDEDRRDDEIEERVVGGQDRVEDVAAGEEVARLHRLLPEAGDVGDAAEVGVGALVREPVVQERVEAAGGGDRHEREQRRDGEPGRGERPGPDAPAGAGQQDGDEQGGEHQQPDVLLGGEREPGRGAGPRDREPRARAAVRPDERPGEARDEARGRKGLVEAAAVRRREDEQRAGHEQGRGETGPEAAHDPRRQHQRDGERGQHHELHPGEL